MTLNVCMWQIKFGDIDGLLFFTVDSVEIKLRKENLICDTEDLVDKKKRRWSELEKWGLKERGRENKKRLDNMLLRTEWEK